VSCRPSKGDHHEQSPRLPPSPFHEHPSDVRRKNGALVTATPKRIKKGVSEGGQFTTSTRAEAEVSLNEAPEGIEPWELAEAVIAGQNWDADQVATRDRWEAKDWEEYHDARQQAEVEAAHSAPTHFEGATTQAFTSEIDGALVVQIDTQGVTPGRTVRVAVNDGDV